MGMATLRYRRPTRLPFWRISISSEIEDDILQPTFLSSSQDCVTMQTIYLTILLNTLIYMAGSVYKALADPTRREILRLLRQRNLSAGEIADHFPVSKPSMSRHFNVLTEANLIQGDRDGNRIIYRLNVSVLEEAILAMMEMFDIGAGGENGQSAG